MIKNVNLWGQSYSEFNDKISIALDTVDLEELNIYAYQEWEINPQWNNSPYYSKLEKFAKDKVLNIFFGCWHSKLWNNNTQIPKHANLIFDPVFWIKQTYKNMQFHNNLLFDVSDYPNKIFLSLNTQPWKHRCQMIDELAKQNLLDYGSISWHIIPKNYEWKFWNPTKLILDEEYTTNLDSYKTLPQQFSTTFMSLVAESTLKCHFLTEKTWMPVFLKKPFLVWGPRGIHQKFSSLGFRLYDEVFDYSFDKIKNDEQRLEALTKQLSNLKNCDLTNLRKKLINTLEFNYNHAVNLANK